MSVAVKSEFGSGNADIEQYMAQLGRQARVAAEVLAFVDSETKNTALLNIAGVINERRELIKTENQEDMRKGESDGLDAAFLDRLLLSDTSIDAMIEGLRQVVSLADPVGEINQMEYRPSGIQVGKMRVPLGVIGIIYESRPNVTIDAAALCLKSGNASILRGGKEAINSNRAIYRCIEQGLQQAGLPQTCVQVINTVDRNAVGLMLNMQESIDVIIPRGGKSLIERVAREASIPVIKHLDGICHVYIDDGADRSKAFDIAVNAKTRRYGVCNAMETLLVANSIAEDLVPDLISALIEKGVDLRGCPRTRQFNPGVSALPPTRTGRPSTWPQYCRSKSLTAWNRLLRISIIMVLTIPTQSLPKTIPGHGCFCGEWIRVR